MQQTGNSPALTLLHLGGQQRLEIADMVVSLSGGGFGQPCKLAADGGHAPGLAVLPDDLALELAHQAVPTQGARSRASYSAIVGIGRS